MKNEIGSRNTWRRLPGAIASLAMIALTGLWTYWGMGELYHEGWWGSWLNRLPYLVPIAICLTLTMVVFTWPIVGGIVIVAAGLFFAWFFSNIFFMFLIMAGIGGLFIVDAVLQRRGGWTRMTCRLPVPGRGARAIPLRTLLALGIPALIIVGVSAAMLPVVLTRVDDGDRSARRIEGNGVTLIWAPEGPGWNDRQPWGGYPSWQSLALYGVPPVGLDDKPGYGRQNGETVFATAADMAATNLCRYLSADGSTLLPTVQDIWRMPTADEVVRSLGRHGENAGCTWQGEVQTQADCRIRPDKESPLWATDVPVIYTWTADESDARQGVYVSYNGWVQETYKLGGNPRHGYRCVREP